MKEFKPVILWISLSLNLFLIVRQFIQIKCDALENEISRIREKIARDNQLQHRDMKTGNIQVFLSFFLLKFGQFLIKPALSYNIILG